MVCADDTWVTVIPPPKTARVPRIAMIRLRRVDRRPLRRRADLYMVHLFLEAECGSRFLGAATI